MKINKLYSAILLLVSATVLSSCEDVFGDFLDKQPSSDLTEEQIFSDWTTAIQYHFDTYNYLRDGACRINESWMDAATDLAITSYASGGVRSSFNIGNYYSESGASELQDTWSHYYYAIRKCNMTLARIDDVPKSVDDSQEKYEADKLYYKSEARFLRAYFYWELFLRYGPLPIILEVLDPNSDLVSNYTTRPSIKEYVVDFVMAELAECEAGLMTKEVSTNAGNQGRICQPIASALYSRIALYMASDYYSNDSAISWSDALAATEDFIDTYGADYGLYTTGTDGVDIYTNAILKNAHNGYNNEVIFWRNSTQIYWSGIYNDTPVGEGGNGGNCPSQNLVDMYDMANGESPFTQYDSTGAPIYNTSDYSPQNINAGSGYSESTPLADRDPRLSASILYNGVNWGNGTINIVAGERDNPTGNANATPTGYYMRKYIPESILLDSHSGSDYRNWIIMRYAEVLLNYAEALNETGASRDDVLDALQPLRDRVGMTAKLKDRSDLQDISARRNFIRKERSVELAFEDHRAWDVRRWGVAEEALARPIYGVDVTLHQGGGELYQRKLAQERVFLSKMYLYPIPEEEMWKINIENNDGWN